MNKEHFIIRPKVVCRLGMGVLCIVSLLLAVTWLGSLDQRRIESWRISQPIEFKKANVYRREFQPTESGITNGRVIVPRISTVARLHTHVPLDEGVWNATIDKHLSSEERNKNIRELVKQHKQKFAESLSSDNSLLSWRILENGIEFDHGVFESDNMSAWATRAAQIHYRFENAVKELDPEKKYTLLVENKQPSDTLSRFSTLFILGPAHRHGKDTVGYFNYILKVTMPLMLLGVCLIILATYKQKTVLEQTQSQPIAPGNREQAPGS
jgi:hypothetical protein